MNEQTKNIAPLLSLARQECCNWFDSGDYCPICEQNEKHCCTLKTNKPCEYFKLSVLPIAKVRGDGGKAEYLYNHIFEGKLSTGKIEIRKCNCGATLKKRERLCAGCRIKKRKETYRNAKSIKRKA